jgi:hypothetical protein
VRENLGKKERRRKKKKKQKKTNEGRDENGMRRVAGHVLRGNAGAGGAGCCFFLSFLHGTLLTGL